MPNDFEIRNLCLSVGGFSLRNINLHLDGHSYIVLLGKVGSGKTVLLKTIAGFFTDHDGEIFLDGEKISSLPPRQRKIGYVPQHNDLFPNMDIRDNISFPLVIRKIDKKIISQRVSYLLDLFDIAKIAERHTDNLSGGERKKVAIARALAHEPKLLLLDEPLGMLDAPARKSVLELLRKIHSVSQVSVIHVSHERRDAWDAGKLCAFMEKGEILQTGSPDDVFRTPKTLSAASFFGSENIFPAKFAKSGSRYLAKVGSLEIQINKLTGQDSGFVTIRPELIEINVVKGENCFTAKVLSISDKGDLCEIRASIIDEMEFIIHCGVSETKNLHIGENVSLYINPNNVHYIKG